MNFGGIVSTKTLKPGESFSTTVGLDKWFRFIEPGTYQVTGILELPLYDPDAADPFGKVIWDELAVGECEIRIVKKEK